MAEGDEMAYRRFYDAYFERLSRYLLVVTGGNEDATREALQRTLMRVVRHVRTFQNEEIFWSWLTVLARSALGDERRRRRRYFAFLDRFKRQTSVDQTTAGANEDGGKRLGELLERQLASLSVEERTLVEKKYFQGQPVTAIAEQLQTTEKAIESRLVRIRRKLKEAILTDLGHETSG